MPDYKQATLNGTEWQRCHKVSVFNPLNGAPQIFFEEERVVSLEASLLKQSVPGCEKAFAVDGTFALLDPATNQPTGITMSHGVLYQALYSLYMQTAKERDTLTPV